MKRATGIYLYLLIISALIVFGAAGCQNKDKKTVDNSAREILNQGSNEKAADNSGKTEANEIASKDEEDAKKTILVRSQQEMWEEIHILANSKIVADEIWGTKEIKTEHIKELIAEVENSSYNDKEMLLEILSRWKAEDFSQCVAEHNYVWEKLGGTIGKAIALREDLD